MAFTNKIPMTTEAANLKLRRVSSSKQNFPGVGRVRVTFASKRTHLEEEGQKYCRHPIGSVTPGLHNGKGCFTSSANIVQTALKDFFYKFLNSAFKSRASLIYLNN